ncbi:MAG: thioredoxin domain-containing protein [Thaumarchaeota archaeon]|nr:thioredoxin domain-containing protein [Nitrososphaerota archaeon]
MRRTAMLAIAGGVAVVIAASAAAALSGGGGGGGVAAMAHAAPVLGDPDAPITIEEWGDYQCHNCERFHGSSLEIIKRDYVETGRAKLVFMDFPLNGPDSALAASASHCGTGEGMDWEYDDALYENWAGERTGWITPASLEEFAGEAGLDAGELSECVESGRHDMRVAETYAHGQAKGVDATPTFLITNGDKVFKIRGNQPLDVFLRVFDEL